MDLGGRTVIVTGAGGAIGSQVVLSLVHRDARVVATDQPASQSLDRVVASAQHLGGEVTTVRADVRVVEDVRRVVQLAIDKYGELFGVVNNAGVLRAVGSVWEAEPEQWRSDLLTNVYGMFLFCRYSLPYLLDRDEGVIVNMTGGGFDGPNPGAAGYAAAKAGVARLTDTLAAELTQHQSAIRVVAIMPGLVRSEMTEFLANSPVGRAWLPHVADGLEARQDVPASSVAETVVRALELGDQLPNGRVFLYDDDLEAILHRRDEILVRDAYQLRYLRV